MSYTYPPSEKKAKWYNHRSFAIIGCSVAALALGFIAGGGGATPAGEPAPSTTITVAADPPAAVVPQECLDALDAAETVFQVSGEMGQLFSDTLDLMTTALTEAAMTGDVSDASVAEMTRITTELTPMSGQVDDAAAIYNPDSDVCRAASN